MEKKKLWRKKGKVTGKKKSYRKKGKVIGKKRKCYRKKMEKLKEKKGKGKVTGWRWIMSRKKRRRILSGKISFRKVKFPGRVDSLGARDRETDFWFFPNKT